LEKARALCAQRPDLAPSHRWRARAANALKDHREAAKSWSRLLEIEPSDAEGHKGAILSNAQLGEEDACLAAAEQARTGVAHPLNLFKAALLGLFQQRRADLAIRIMADARWDLEGREHALRSICVALMEEGDAAGAHAAALASLTHHPDNATLRDVAATATERLERADEALKWLALMVEAEPDNPDLAKRYTALLVRHHALSDTLRFVARLPPAARSTGVIALVATAIQTPPPAVAESYFKTLPPWVLDSPLMIAARGQTAARRGDRASAKELLLTLLSNDDPAIAGHTIRTAVQFGDVDLIKRAYEQIPKAGEGNAQRPPLTLAPAILGAVQVALGDYEGAYASAPQATGGALHKVWGEGGATAIILDPGFNQVETHHLHLNTYFSRFFAGRAHKTTIYASRRLPLDAAGELTVSRHFAFEPYRFDALLSDLEAARRVNGWFHHECQKTPVANHVEVMAIHSVRLSYGLGLAHWLANALRVGGQSIKKVVIGIIETDSAAPDHPHHQTARALYREMLTMLSEIDGVDIILYVETEAGRTFLSALSPGGPPIKVYPYLASALLSEAMGARAASLPRPAGPLRVGFMGSTRADRGPTLLPYWVDATAQDDIAWHIQVDVEKLRNLLPMGERHRADSLRRAPNATLYAPGLDTAAFAALMNAVDVVLLPYDSRSAVSGSGVFFEALALGKIPVVPEHSAMHSYLRQQGVPTFTIDTDDPRTIVAQLRDIASRKDALLSHAREKALAAATRNPPQNQFAQRFDAGPT
ncbi:MAG: tetratricopeptide repeat protein, partial [Pseudomonadota bacterium]